MENIEPEQPLEIVSQGPHIRYPTMSEVTRLREALAFYANPESWETDGVFIEPRPDDHWRPDCGETARRALA